MPTPSKTVTLSKRGIMIGGKHEVLLCASLFYFRLPRAVWRDRISKLKRVGYNCVDVYFPWNYHEREDGSFDFEGERDVGAFLEELKCAGIYAVARPGPYICSEWDGGALPARILESGIPIRCDDSRFLAETEKWYRAVLHEIAPYTYGNGGTVILLQLENELDFFDCPDPQAYISRLAAIARESISDIPFFCCAGQYGLTRAGAFTAGVEGTLNCYPDSMDPTFDSELAGYALRFAADGKPLMVTETNRDHFLLRRELSAGAKLLGAYCQVAGVNFGHRQAINNWGRPDSMIVTVYDFESMIDAAGAFRPEAEEGALFAAFLRVAGEAVAAAEPSPETVIPEFCSFRTAEGGLRVLNLPGGGAAVCAPDFSEDGEVAFTCRGIRIEGGVAKGTAPFFLFGLDLSAHGIGATLTRANAEPIFADKENLVFYAPFPPMAGLDFGDGETILTRDGDVHGVHVRFVGRKEALGIVAGGLSAAAYASKPFTEFFTAELPPERAASGCSFSSLGIEEGRAVYTLRPAGASLFLEHPCDIMTVTADGKRGDTLFADGRDVVLPPCGEAEIVVEKWGHCNFDDPQSPALRTSSKKGVSAFYEIDFEETIGRCDFTLLDSYGDERVDLGHGYPIRIGVEKWNSTRKPVVCAYTLPARKRSERMVLQTTEACDVAVYLDGALAGECDFGTFDLSPYFGEEERLLTLVYRKRVWTQEVGSARILHMHRVQPLSVRVRTERELVQTGNRGEQIALPLPVGKERALYASLPKGKERYLKFTGKNVKLTCVMDGKVIGRLICGWDHAPALEGGDPALLYLCPAWSGELYLLAEALGEGAVLEGAETVETV